jgi:hypothetical protein
VWRVCEAVQMTAISVLLCSRSEAVQRLCFLRLLPLIFRCFPVLKYHLDCNNTTTYDSFLF